MHDLLLKKKKKGKEKTSEVNRPEYYLHSDQL